MSDFLPDEFNVTCYYKLMLGGTEVGNFESVSGLNVIVDIQEYREGGENSFTHKLRGPTRFSNIICRRGSTDSLELWEWIENCIKGEVERKSGSIIAMGRDSATPVCTWNFFGAIPCAYRGPDFASRNLSDIAIEELEIAIERFETVKG